MGKMGKVEELVFSTLKKAEKDLTLAEIAERTGEAEKKIFKALRKLFENGAIETENRRYRLCKS